MIQKLYHYTTLNTLALILSTQMIRFGRLDKVNDPTEGQSSDFHSLAVHIFVSCWTKSADENLALWNMYTPQMRGVRLELTLPIFNSYTHDEIGDLLCNKDDAVNERDKIFVLGGKNTPFAIDYTNDPEKLNPKIKTQNGLNVDQLGRTKKTIWSFEEEYRYKLHIVPLNNNLSERFFPNRYMDLVDNATPPSIDGYPITISQESFRSMKILLSPKSQPGDKEIISALVDKYNPNAAVFDSALKGHVR